MVVKTPLTWLPRAIRTEMATTEMKARIKAYSTRVWPFLLLKRRSAFLELIITLLIIVFSPPLYKKFFQKIKVVVSGVAVISSVIQIYLGNRYANFTRTNK